MVVANDGTSVVGDLPGYGEDAYFGEDAAYTAVPESNESYDYEDEIVDGDEAYQGDSIMGDVQPVGHTQRATQRASGRSVMRQASARINRSNAAMPARQMYPTQQMQPVSHQMMGSGYNEGGYVDGGYVDGGDCGCGDNSCGGGSSCGADMSCGCGSSACGGGSSCRTHKRMCKLFDRSQGNTWAQMDLLLWFPQGRKSPSLIAESDAGTLPILDPAISPSTRTVFGGENDAELSAGFRADAGIWLTDNVGVGGRFWTLAENGQSYAFSGNGDDISVGRPFFNTNSALFAGNNGGEDSLPIALTGVAGGPDLSGSVNAESALDIWAAEAYARLRFGCTKSCQLDFIAGYSHFDIADSLFINSTTTIEGTGGAPPAGSAVGDSVSYLDQAMAENTFDGGQLGFEMVMNRGRWTARSLTKVHLGNMNQAIAINGSSITTPATGAPTSNPGGILAGNTPIAVERDVFAFAPEANFKLGYQFRPNVALTVGYSFIYFDNVALTGTGIDRLVDGATLGTGLNDNGFLEDDSSLFVHGIDLGFVIDF
ncbi:BBP7 family outer membrane beta-barrel protein [Rubripirellula obstinata]|nr:BBP7 family outer membrane beta-barrel protein [Rubripirellula obstinata]